jgi:transcriptional regulator EpsA
MGNNTRDFELSAADARLYVRLAREATDVASREDFKTWAETSVRKLFPHEMLIAGVAHRNVDRVAVEHLLPVGFPMPFIDAVTARRGAFACPTLEAWFREGRPQLYEPEGRHAYAEPNLSTTEFKAYNLKNVAAHGVSDLSGKYATYFSFSQVPTALTERHTHLLELLAPHLRLAYIGATRLPGAQRKYGSPAPHSDRPDNGSAETQTIYWAHGFHLTAREREILYWLGLGKTNEEISKAVHRARDTIKHQISDILAKLNVRNRHEAVALAIRLGLLPNRRAMPPAQDGK